MEAIIVVLGITLSVLILSPNYYHLSKVFRVLKVLTAISFVLPILVIVWLFAVSSDLATTPGAEYVPDMFFGMMFVSTACVGGLAFAWLVGFAYWLYAKRTNLFEISSLQVALMLVAAVVGWFAIGVLVPLVLFGKAP